MKKPISKLDAILDGILDAIIEEARHGTSNGRGRRAFSTGFPYLDQCLPKNRRGTLIVIGSPPAMGATTFMLNMVEHVCVNQSIPTLIFSYDLTSRALIHRLTHIIARKICANADGSKRSKILSLDHIIAATELIRESPLAVEDDVELTLPAIKRKVFAHKEIHPDGFIAIDRLQLIPLIDKSVGTTKGLAADDMTRKLKRLALEVDYPILLLAEAHSEVSGQNYGHPTLSNLKNRKAIMSHTDLTGMLYREAHYAPTEESMNQVAHLLMFGFHGDLVNCDIPLTYGSNTGRFMPVDLDEPFEIDSE